MKILEILGGVVIAVLSLFVLLVGMIVSFSSMGRYLKAKNM